MFKLDLLQEQCSICFDQCEGIKGEKKCKDCEINKEIKYLISKELEEELSNG